MPQVSIDHIIRLLIGHITDSLTPEEEAELQQWRQHSQANEEMVARISDPDYIKRNYLRRKIVNTDRAKAEMQQRLGLADEPTHNNRRWAWWATAASLLILIGAATWWWSGDNEESAPLVAETPIEETIVPGSTRATLSISGIASVELSEPVENAKDAIPELPISDTDEPRSLCLDVPRGGEFKVVLSDSTEVWLNSDTKLIYPEQFTGGQRRVCLVGEAYFHVSHADEAPFYVETEGQQVRVYGTQFNVRCYPEDANVRTTLVEGSISLSKTDEPSREVMLKPGHQSQFSRHDHALTVIAVNTDVVTSWRHGRFVFENQTLEQIMCDLSRWYDFNYDFADPSLSDIMFMGSVPRYAEFATALAILEKSGGLKFTVDGKHVQVKQALTK